MLFAPGPHFLPLPCDLRHSGMDARKEEGSCRCTAVGLPRRSTNSTRGGSVSACSSWDLLNLTFAVLKLDICAPLVETPWYTYCGTPPTG